MTWLKPEIIHYFRDAHKERKERFEPFYKEETKSLLDDRSPEDNQLGKPNAYSFFDKSHTPLDQLFAAHTPGQVFPILDTRSIASQTFRDNNDITLRFYHQTNAFSAYFLF